MNVVHNAKRNVAFGTINRLVFMICPFIDRTLISRIIGEQYLGIEGLFTSILTVLSLSELGFSSAIVYNMYKPASEGNISKINALLYYYRRIYRIIGLIIALIGVALIPFLPKLIKGSYPSDIRLPFVYLIFLANTVISYFSYAYMQSIIVVHQREDVNSFVNSVIRIGMTVAQIIVLVLTKSYYLYALMMPIFTILNNIWLAYRVHRLFPQYKAEGMITSDDKKKMKKNVIGTFINRACNVTRNSLDTICISAFIGLTMTAIYGNYYLIMSGITSMIAIVRTAFVGGVGNHVATKSVAENYDEMKKLDFVYLWLSGWAAICLACLFQPVMLLWMGADMMLPELAVLLFVAYFYLLKLGDIRSLYTQANGLWWEQRYRAIGETVMNVMLNIILGKLMGVFGIILATMISLLSFNYIGGVRITFKHYFSMDRVKDYYLYQGSQTAVTLLAFAVTYALCSLLRIENLWVTILVRGALCVAVPNAIFYAIYRRTERFMYALRIVGKHVGST